MSDLDLAPATGIVPDSLWRHHSGRRYHVVFLTNEFSANTEKYPVTVVYRGVVNGRRWSKSRERFLATMTREIG
jgi:hypothetical protein